MIILFPMLTSKSVSPNIIPGLCKSLEKFILVYKMDTVMKTAGIIGGAIGASRIAASSLMKSEAEDMLMEQPQNFPIHRTKDGRFVVSQDDMLRIFLGQQKQQGSGGRKYEDEAEERAKAKEERDIFDHHKRKDDDAKRHQRDLKGMRDKDFDNLQQHFKLDVHFPTANSISIEPTWVMVSSRFSSQILGVKVVPFYVDSDADIVAAMSHDRALANIDKKIHSMVRRVVRLFFSVLRKIPSPFKYKKVISSDIEDTILFAKTEHGSNIFLCLNYSDINDSSLVLSAKSLSKLFSLGWGSFIAADDVNKRAIFCMKEFKGMCSTIQYPFLFSLSRETLKVYDSLEDVKKSASPFFRMATTTKKVLGESLAFSKVNDYLKLMINR